MRIHHDFRIKTALLTSTSVELLGLLRPVDESRKSTSFNIGEDFDVCKEQIRDNLVVIQTPRGGPTSKGRFSLSPPKTIPTKECNKV